jgi:hypothetical protein
MCLGGLAYRGTNQAQEKNGMAHRLMWFEIQHFSFFKMNCSEGDCTMCAFSITFAARHFKFKSSSTKPKQVRVQGFASVFSSSAV